MYATVRAWLSRMWQAERPDQIREAYLVTFSTMHGRIVLQHLLDNVYCTVSDSIDPNEALVLNARRSVIDEILRTLDYAANPSKYTVSVQDGHAGIEDYNAVVR